jgi:putative transposase
VWQRGALTQFPVRKHPRLPRPVYQDGHIFFLTCSTYARFPWFERFEELALASIKLLESLTVERGTDIFAWCFMPDHCHLLVRDEDTVEFIRRFKGRLSPIARKMERGRSLWQKSFYDHALRKSESVFRVAGYIWENPVRAGLADSPEEYVLSGSLVWPDWRLAYTT